MPITDVDYAGRPNKSLVRSRLWDATEDILRPRHDHAADLSFITFSGFKFVDSLEFYGRFNIRRIYSIENNPRIYTRALFNLPYEFVDVTRGGVTDFIDRKFGEVIETRKVIYLDYERKLNDNVLSDVEALFSAGFFGRETLLFVTFNRGFDRKKLTPRVSDIVPDNIKSQTAYDGWLPDGFASVIEHQVRRKHGRRKAVREVLRAFYQDTSPMVAFGYHIRDSYGEEKLYRGTGFEEFTLPPLTFLEANYIHNHLSESSSTIAARLGITEKDVESYKKYA